MRSSFMLKLRADDLMLSQASVITSSYLISSFGLGYSCILIILSTQFGSCLERRYPAFISFIESPTTIMLFSCSVLSSSISCSCRNFLIFHCEGCKEKPLTPGSTLAEMTSIRSFIRLAVLGMRVSELQSTQCLWAFDTIIVFVWSSVAFLSKLYTMSSIWAKSSLFCDAIC